MRNRFLTKRNALVTPSRVTIGAAALVCALLALLMRLVFPGTFFAAMEPLLNLGTSFADVVHVTLSGFESSTHLNSKLESLVRENESLVNENRLLQARVDDLRKLIGEDGESGRSLPESGILAGVVMRPPVSGYDTLLIAAGESIGVTKGMEVLTAGGVPIGVVSDAWQKFSRVVLLSATNVTTQAWVGETRAPLELRGAGAGAFSASAPRASDIKEGDMVFAPGPGALPVGVVARLSDDPSSPTVTVYVKPTVNPFTVTWVTVHDVGSGLTKFRVTTTTTTE